MRCNVKCFAAGSTTEYGANRRQNRAAAAYAKEKNSQTYARLRWLWKEQNERITLRELAAVNTRALPMGTLIAKERIRAAKRLNAQSEGV